MCHAPLKPFLHLPREVLPRFYWSGSLRDTQGRTANRRRGRDPNSGRRDPKALLYSLAHPLPVLRCAAERREGVGHPSSTAAGPPPSHGLLGGDGAVPAAAAPAAAAAPVVSAAAVGRVPAKVAPGCQAALARWPPAPCGTGAPVLGGRLAAEETGAEHAAGGPEPAAGPEAVSARPGAPPSPRGERRWVSGISGGREGPWERSPPGTSDSKPEIPPPGLPPTEADRRHPDPKLLGGSVLALGPPAHMPVLGACSQLSPGLPEILWELRLPEEYMVSWGCRYERLPESCSSDQGLPD